ncbi:uncharacterized protein [Arachis hypogaea]|uniref:uncharacterized protein isoform X5 n=1 Tax=Arachis hypogaea TaxID=3818 RepID=UPI003B219647
MKLGVKGRHRGNTLGEIAGEKAGIFKLLRCLSLTKQCLKRRLNGLRLGLEDLPLLSNLNLNRCNITDDGCEKFSRPKDVIHLVFRIVSPRVIDVILVKKIWIKTKWNNMKMD